MKIKRRTNEKSSDLKLIKTFYGRRKKYVRIKGRWRDSNPQLRIGDTVSYRLRYWYSTIEID